MKSFFQMSSFSQKPVSRLLGGTPENAETRAISPVEIRATNFSWRYSAVEKWKYSCGATNFSWRYSAVEKWKYSCGDMKLIKATTDESAISNLVASKWAYTSRLNNKTLATQRFWTVAYKKFFGLADQGLSSEIFYIDNNHAVSNLRIETSKVSEVFVECEKNATLPTRMFKNFFISGFGKRYFTRMHDRRFGNAAQSLDQVAVNALVGENTQPPKGTAIFYAASTWHENREHALGVRDAGENLSWILENTGGESNRGNNVVFGNAIVLSGNFVNRISSTQEIQNVGNSNTRPANSGLTKSDIGIDCNVFVHNTDSIANGPLLSSEETKQAQSFESACIVPATGVLTNTATLGSSLSDAQTDKSIPHGMDDVGNNGHRITVYLHTRNRFSFYFCTNMRPIAYQWSCPRLGRLAQNAVYRLTSRDVNRQLVDVGCFSLFAATWFRKFNVPRNRPTRSYQLSNVLYSPERECFSQTIISNTTLHLPRMITPSVCVSRCAYNENVDKRKDI